MTDQDQDIWRAFLNGDKSAFEKLLLRYYRPMFDYGLRFQPDEEQLRDDLHDLMVNLWERRAHLHTTDHLKFYLFKALRHQIFNRKQKQTVWADYDQIDEYDECREEKSMPPFVEEEAFKLQSGQIQKTLIRLSKRQREVLHLKFFEELSNEEIAHVLNISRPATANLLYAALKAFKVLWRAEHHFLIVIYFIHDQILMSF